MSTDLRMLYMLQEIRKFAFDELEGDKFLKLFALCNQAIAIDLRLFEERIGLKPKQEEPAVGTQA